MNKHESTTSGTFDDIAGTTRKVSSFPWLKRKVIKILGLSIESSLSSGRKLSKRQKREFRQKKEEFFITSAQELLANNTNDAFIIDSSRKLLVQQRIMEDTNARRRLEKWARNTIIIYLLIVFLLVLLNGMSQIVWPEHFDKHGFITDTVMTVILSTTTINIIGLGVIVLKGHFPNYIHEDRNDALNNTNSSNITDAKSST